MQQSNIPENDDVPPNMREVANEVGIETIKCKQCQCVANTYYVCNYDGYNTGECVQFECGGKGCQTWGYCFSCKKRLGYNALKGHVASNTHKKKSGQTDIQDTTKSNKRQKSDASASSSVASPAAHAGAAREDDELHFAIEDDGGSVADLSTAGFLHAMDQEMKDSADDAEVEASRSEREGVTDGHNISQIALSHPELNLKGCEWLQRELTPGKRAAVHEVSACFEGLQKMNYYWVSEHASPIGRGGGGLRYLVASTFQRCGEFLDQQKMPSYPEAQWHIESFIQYHTMTDKQRQRQSRITKSIMGHLKEYLDGHEFFSHTTIPEYREIHKYYGRYATQSLWNLLPIPPIENVEGVAYVSPVHIAKFVFANGLPTDDFIIRMQDRDDGQSFDDKKLVFHVTESHKAFLWERELVNNRHTFPELKKAVACWFSDWVDGFGPSRTKNNRGSVDAWTFTCSPPKDSVNSTNNTFLMAVGLKKAKGWTEVSRRIRSDFQVLSSVTRPMMLYHGSLRQMVPVFFKHFASIEDKAERPDTSGTIGSGSDLHRCFGVIAKIETPECKVDEAKAYLDQVRHRTTPSTWGWCDDYIQTAQNGSKFPSCKNCRRNRLGKLGALDGINTGPNTDCKNCCDWELLGQNSELLAYTPNQEYPKLAHEGCPVEPPKGREAGLERLRPLKLTFTLMRQACRFAFFNCSRREGSWTKGTCQEFLRNCGLSKNDQKALFEAAKAARRSDDVIDYTDSKRIGDFFFPAGWTGELDLEDHIEAVMHLLHLGIGVDILEAASDWMKASKEKGVSSVAFRRAIQPLMRDLKKLQLSWLMVYPFTGDENDLKTGSWVAENWSAFTRISPIVYGWSCGRDKDVAVGEGFPDLARVVLSFHAVVARVQTHAGVNQAFLDETKLYMKEFLSSVRELDVRLRYNVLRKRPNVREKGDKKSDALWLKSNFMSLLNIPATMAKLGPIVLWMDGGGKGERFIQEVKPHIKRGIREDAKRFFPILMGKVYKTRQIEYMEQRFGLNLLEKDGVGGGDDDGDGDDLVDLIEAVESIAIQNNDNDADDDDSDADDEDAARDLTVKQLTESVSKVEDAGMWKKSTIYIYRNERELNAAAATGRPIAGILQENATGGTFDFVVVFRKPVKQFARRNVVFGDAEGLSFHGMWYAPIQIEEEHIHVTGSLASIKKEAKMSVVAIPLHYIIGEGKADSRKYCVISNWWRTRNYSGVYSLPHLDSSLYPTDVDAEVTNNPRAI